MSHIPEEHGTTSKYVIGYILSLIFTLVPYYIVRNTHGTSRTTLLTILGLAFIQLIIQITYFLHLGRGPKSRWELGFFIATACAILVVVGGSLIIITNLHHNMNVADQEINLIDSEAIAQVGGKLTGACQQTHVNHQVILTENSASPRHISANQCDTLSFTNKSKMPLTINFGAHDHHHPYAGITEFSLRPGMSDTITLSQAGAYLFHDHERPNIAGSFTVFDDQSYSQE